MYWIFCASECMSCVCVCVCVRATTKSDRRRRLQKRQFSALPPRFRSRLSLFSPLRKVSVARNTHTHTYIYIYIQNYNVRVHAVLNHSSFMTIFQLLHRIIYIYFIYHNSSNAVDSGALICICIRTVSRTWRTLRYKHINMMRANVQRSTSNAFSPHLYVLLRTRFSLNILSLENIGTKPYTNTITSSKFLISYFNKSKYK